MVGRFKMNDALGVRLTQSAEGSPLLLRKTRVDGRARGTLAALVSIAPEPPSVLVPPPSPPNFPPLGPSAARLAMASVGDTNPYGLAGGYEAGSGPLSPGGRNRAPLELSWRMVDSRKDAIFDQKSVAVRVRRTITSSGNSPITLTPPDLAIRPLAPSTGAKIVPPLMQVSSILPLESHISPLAIDSTRRLGDSTQDLSPGTASTISGSSLSKRNRMKDTARLRRIDADEVPSSPTVPTDLSAFFSVSAVRLDASKRGTLPVAPAVLQSEITARVPAAIDDLDPSKLERKVLAEALNSALAKLQSSRAESWDDVMDTEGTPACHRSFSCFANVGFEEGRTADSRHASKVRAPDGSTGKAGLKRASFTSGDFDPLPDSSPSGSRRKARALTGAQTSVHRSRSMPAEAKKGAEKICPGIITGPWSEREGWKGSLTNREGSEDRPLYRKTMKTASQTANWSLPKSTAAAGAASSAVKVKKKNSVPRKMVLPFSYGFDDPRYWHVESTEGQICPDFLPT